jgi:hypothetical protein
VVLTLNAWWDEDAKKWYGTNGQPTMALRFGNNGMLFTMRTEGMTDGWIENTTDGSWGDAASPGNTDSVLLSPSGMKIFGQGKSAILKSDGGITASGGITGDDSSVTVIGGVVGPAGTVSIMGNVPVLGSFISFPRPFATTPTQVTVHADASIYAVGGIGLGSTFDANVASSYIVPTPYGIYIQIVPTALGLYTSWRRVITVSA